MISIITAGVSFVLDRWTKVHMEKKLTSDNTPKGIGDIIQFKLMKNKGLMLGKLKQKPHIVKGLNIGAAILALILILPLIVSKNITLTGKLGIGMLFGGGLGNLYDRMKHGEVTDFFAFKWYPRIVFNLADMFIFLGCFIVLIAELTNGLVKQSF
ncbi:signal peptidase II [Vallitalea okinawensis]|uniref:signal peptidase II n=1 Tax=Vallitalea okinawensis TaxID=2078660 RepID=UPI000CFC3956|nr:signal peptidase II [Vallitalea okinawensis]